MQTTATTAIAGGQSRSLTDPASKARPLASSVRDAKGTVLLVEDERDTREMLAMAIERAGYTCMAAGGGDEALARATVLAPVDVVVTDVVMEGNDRRGLTLMNELRGVGVRAPIIVITAYADLEKAKIALNQGAVHLLEKPFHASDLVEVIGRVRGQPGDVRRRIDHAFARANLTDKQTVVARHLVEGRTSREIAEIERNSPRTIRQHVTQIYEKCGARNRAEFMRIVYAPRDARSGG
ncbi:MAG: response regulator [Polyangiaceae bacterium]